MSALDQLLLGLKVGVDPLNLLFCFLGCLVGTLIGVLPGIGPIGAISMLLPVTFSVPPVSAIIMLAGIYYGAQYGGSTTSILVNIPGEASSVITCLDGYHMARNGRAGPALGMAALGSFIAATLAIMAMTVVAEPLANLGLKFGPPEYFSIMVLALTILCYLAQQSMLKGVIIALFGLILSYMGTDIVTGGVRFTFGVLALSDGINLVPLVMGLFGISEVLLTLEKDSQREIITGRVTNFLPTLSDWAVSIWAILRGTVIGFILGIIPGAGPVISPFISYATEKRLSKYPEKFGTGVIEGVAGPESANNAAAQASFIPLFTLGIPSNATMAIFFGALVIYGLQPGPLLVAEHPEFFWGVVTSMYIGNILLLVLNLPLIPLWVQVLRIPYRLLFPLIILFCLIGAFSINYRIVDVFVMIVFGVIGYLMKKYGYDAAPLVMAFVLGPLLEENLRRSLILEGGSFSVFVSRPISAVILLITAALLPILFRRKKLAVIQMMNN